MQQDSGMDPFLYQFISQRTHLHLIHEIHSLLFYIGINCIHPHVILESNCVPLVISFDLSDQVNEIYLFFVC